MGSGRTRSMGSSTRVAVLVLAGLFVLVGAATAVATGTTAVITLTGTTYAADVAFSPDGATAYATLEGDNKVSVIDVATQSVVTTIANPGGSLAIDTPRGIAATANRVFVVSANNGYVGVISRGTNTYESRILMPGTIIGDSEIRTIVIDPASPRAYVLRRSPAPSASGDSNGSLTALDTGTLVVGTTATGLIGANDVALSVDGATAYVASLAGGVTAIDTATMTVDSARTITVAGARFVAVAADPRGQYLYAYRDVDDGTQFPYGDQLQVIDIATRAVVHTVQVPDGESWNEIVVSPDGGRAFLSSQWGGSTSPYGTLAELDISVPAAAALTATFPTQAAYGLGMSPTGAHVYTAMNTSPGKVMALTMAAPGAPTQATAVAGEGSATVSWTAPTSDGGAPILSYQVASVEDPAKTCTTSASLPTAPALTCTVSGLTAGRSYTFTVTARNGIGDGAASAASNAVVPTGPAAAGGGADAAQGAASSSGGSTATGASVRVVSATSTGRAVAVRLRVSGAGRIVVRGTVARAGGGRSGVCAASTTVRRAGTVTVLCTLNRRGRALLAASPLSVRVAVAFTGRDGQVRRATRTVRLAAVVPAPPEPVTG